MALAVVQAKKIESGSAGSVTVNSAWTITSGNLIVASVGGWAPTALNSSASDSINGTYTARRRDQAATNDAMSSLHDAINVTGGTPNLTANGGTGATYVTASFHEVSGADTTAPFTTGEAGGGNSGSGLTTNPVTPAVTNSNPNSIFFATLTSDGPSNPTTLTVNSTGSSPTGWALKSTTDSQELNGVGFEPFSTAFLIVSSSAATKHGWTIENAKCAWSIACWKAAASGGTTPSATDTIAESDSFAIAAALPGTDGHGLTDQVGIGLLTTDPVAFSDTVGLGIGATDTAVESESASLAATLPGTDAHTVTDQVGIGLLNTDPAVLTDTPSLAAAVAGADATTLSDQVALANALTAADPVTETESAQVAAALAATDATTQSETASLAAAIGPTDAVGMGDQFAGATALGPTDAIGFTETVSIASSGGTLSISATDAIGFSETISITVTLTATDSMAQLDGAGNAVSVTDTAGHSEGVPSLTAALAAQDAVAFADGASIATAGSATVLVTDTAVVSESVSISVSVSATDTLGETERVPGTALAASDTLAHGDGASLSIVLAATDSSSMADAAAVSILGATTITATDTVRFTDQAIITVMIIGLTALYGQPRPGSVMGQPRPGSLFGRPTA